MTFTIKADKRAAGDAEALRAALKVPGVLYGGDRTEPVSVAVGYQDLEKLYNEAGESSLIDFSLAGTEPVKVLIQDVQFDPVRDRITHVDFRQIKMNEEMTATVELAFTGEAPAVKELGGTLVKTLNSVTVTCLPKDLVSEIVVDLSQLKTFDDTIHVGSLTVPAGITIEDNPELMVAKVTPPLTEEELKAMEETSAPVDISAIEVEKKGKKEEEAEGETSAAE